MKEREKETEGVKMRKGVCVWKRGRERVCVCEREREIVIERERERERSKGGNKERSKGRNKEKYKQRTNREAKKELMHMRGNAVCSSINLSKNIFYTSMRISQSS